MGHIHAAAMAEYAKDALETDKPWERWEFSCGNQDYKSLQSQPLWVADFRYRRKPKTTTTHTSAQQPEAKRDVDAADTIRLNWLDAQVKNHAVHNGFLWQEGGWESNRGLVCEIQGNKQKKTVRQAIDAAIAAQTEKEGEKK